MSKNEPLAIVGMACRFPGGASSPQAFWELLRDGVDAISEVPPARWNAARFYHPNAAAPGRMVTRWGGFVENADKLDAAFFGIAPREAACLDPQHRWLLETTWEALEDAGWPPEKLSGSRTGVFIGISHSDYPNLHRNDAGSIDRYTNIGSAFSIAANRLSYLFNLRGPSFAVDTACSSSLMALHLAARSLWQGECDYALVGGANAVLSPEGGIGFSQAHMLSPRGRCRAFDASADGYVRAEGAATLVVMPLRTAQNRGLHPRALLMATAANQDGHSHGGITVPSQKAQEAMIREALADSGLEARDVVYLEAHGTGTPVGDPIEARAIANVLAAGRPAGERLLMGSVKTNVGHLEPASGLAGLIKAVLVLEQRMIPPNLHFEQPNPRLPLDRVTVPTALTPLPELAADRTPLVGVNSFGFGGSNVHALLAPPPATELDTEGADEGEACVFPFSARSPEALTEYAAAYAKCIDGEKGALSLRALCAAAALGKSQHPLRRALVVDSLTDLRTQLLATPAPPAATPTAQPKLAFIFSGQGPQWWAMGRGLFHREKIVRDFWDRCDAICRAQGGPNLLDELLADEASSRLNHTDIAQPALFALQGGLVELWRAWGIEPAAVLGHSVGEAAAAWTAGIFDLEGIFRVILARSRAQATTRGQGRMLAASITAGEARDWAQRFPGRVSLAAINAPRQVTLSGEAAALEEIVVTLEKAKIFCRLLPTEYAFHSAQMNPLEAGLRSDLAGIAGAAAKSPTAMISTVTGEPVRGPEMDADYWWRNVRQPVRFAAGVAHLLRDGCTALVEIGPHPVLAAALTEIALAEKTSPLTVASLRRAEDERRTLLHALGSLYQHGAAVRWEALYSRPKRALRLPAYPWQRQRLWHEAHDVTREFRSAAPHPLLGDRQPHPHPVWFGQLDARLLPWLNDHRLTGSAVVPAAAYLEMAAAAVREFLGETTVFLEDIRFHHLLFLPEEKTVASCVRLDPAVSSFQILTARPDAPDEWELQAEGIYRPGRLHVPPPGDLDAIREGCPDEHDPAALYTQLDGIGQVYGPTFRGLQSLRLQGHEAVLAGIRSTGGNGASDYLLYPPALDSCFHSSFALRRSQDKRAVIIMSLRQLRIFLPLPNEFFAHLRLVEHWKSSHLGDITLLDPAGQVLAELNGLKLLAIDSAASKPGQRERKFYGFAWELQQPPPQQQPMELNAEPVLVFADREGFAESLAASLRARGVSPTLVFRAADRNGDSLAVDLRQPDWAENLLGALAARGPLPARLLYLWNWDDDTAAGCAAFLALIQARLKQPGSEQPARWLVATRRVQAVDEHEDLAPAPAAIWGFARSVQTEQPQWRLSLADCADASCGKALLHEFFAPEIEPEVALRRAGRHAHRLRPLQPAPADDAPPPPAYALGLEGAGRVDALQFRGQARKSPGAGEVEIEIAAAGLNFRDLMKALGIYPLAEDETVGLGDEFAGRVVRIGRGVRRLRVGDRVMGFSPAGGAFSSHLVSAADAVWKIPASLSFAEGASIPVVFGTAYHALHSLARLRRGESVLIHAAAGGVGLAALQLAQRIGATVFATAGSEEKRTFVRGLGVEQVLDSRTLDFADEILRLTGGRGVDVVLNSLAGAFQGVSLAVCAPHGRFVEIGKRDLFEKNLLPLAAFQRSLAFFAFDLSTVLASPREEGRALRRFLAHGFADGKLRPIPCTTFPARDAVAAFRRMQAAQHIGKLVLEFDSAHMPKVPPEFWPHAEGTYLVTGGLSGFGLATAQWLAGRGARHLALLSRRGIASATDTPAIEALRADGVSVVTLAADVADAKSLATALRRLQKTSPPLRGIFHSAMVLRDKFLADMTQDDLAAVLAPKRTGAWNLHLQTRDLPGLDCFVLFSSISSIIGAPGHANYAAANAFLDALAQHRRATGLHGLSVNWGQLDDVGVAAEKAEIKRYLEGIGVRAVPARDALAALARWIVAPAAQVGVMDVDWEKLARTSVKFTGSPVFRELAQGSAGKADGIAGNWRETVRALPAEEQGAAVSRLVIAQVAATLGMAPEAIDPDGPLTGMDSLMAVELKVRIEEHSGCALPIDALNADATAARLADRLLKQIATAAPDTAAAPAATTPVVGVLAESAAPLLRSEATPLLELIHDGRLPPLVAGALMPWPITLFQQTGVVPAEFFERMHGREPRVSLDIILETPLGPVGIFMLPLTTSQVTPGEATLLPLALEGIRHATTCGARCVALTGLIPSATNYGASVQTICDAENLAPVTTGHATTVAAVLLNLIALLQVAERELAAETVMFYGIGSIGLGALRLMLDVLPHPAGLHLCDPFRSAAFFTELETTLREEHGFHGEVRVVAADAHFHDATVILGATNVENVLDVVRLAPGTLVVDDSSPHCLNGPAAFARFREHHDVLFTEGGFVRGAAPIPRTVHVPPLLAPQMQAEIPQLFFSLLRSEDITGCILSALLSAQRPDLAPTIGLVAPAAARQHWHALAELGFTAAALNYEGTYLDANGIAAFRENTGAFTTAIRP